MISPELCAFAFALASKRKHQLETLKPKSSAFNQVGPRTPTPTPKPQTLRPKSSAFNQVGPSRPNRRIDGALGGLVVEKCKFLQESGCKGMCMNICKLPAEQFFDKHLGLPLTVTPNFETQVLPTTKDLNFESRALHPMPTLPHSIRVSLDDLVGSNRVSLDPLVDANRDISEMGQIQAKPLCRSSCTTAATANTKYSRLDSSQTAGVPMELW